MTPTLILPEAQSSWRLSPRARLTELAIACCRGSATVWGVRHGSSQGWPRRLAWWLGCWSAAVVAVATLQAAERLAWLEAENRVDAEFQDWPLHRVLEKIAAKTRWQVYIEPETDRRVTVKFTGLKPGEALQRLLGKLNFAFVPAAEGPARLLIYRTSPATATELVAAPADADETGKAPRAIPNELVVVLKPGATESIEDLARRLGATVVGRADELRAYRLRFDDETGADAARSALSGDASIESVELNFEVARPERPELLALGSVPPLRLRPRATADGSRVVVGLVDTAVQTEGTVLKDFLLPGVALLGQVEAAAGMTHGTSMAQTILYTLAQAPDAADGTPVRILPVDIYGNGSSTTTYDVARGISAAIQAGATVVNLSLGSDTDSGLVRSVIQAGHQQGVIFPAAAGNEPVATPTYPAAYPEAIAVTAIGRDGALAAYANRGEFVDVAAPGTSVVPFQGRSYLVVGTSAATANVSAVAAAVAATSGKRGADLEQQLRQALGVKSSPGKP